MKTDIDSSIRLEREARTDGSVKIANGEGPVPTEGQSSATDKPDEGDGVVASTPAPPSPDDDDQLWADLTENGTKGLIGRYEAEVDKVYADFADITEQYCVLSVYGREDSINAWEMDEIYAAITKENANKQKDVLLFIVSSGGEVEPAYHIARLGRAFAREKFVVAVPREAKSAATLIALGADTIHMGLLGELGPIDPQLGGLPALAVEQALKTLALITAEHPESAMMFASYLKSVIRIEQIGYSQRIGESAVQYAEMLLAPKKERLSMLPSAIANHLVYALKDHSFVIDRDEAKRLLGQIVVHESREVQFAERVYRMITPFEVTCWARKKRLEIVGSLRNGANLWKAS
jgi:hypothetical protein